MLAAVDDGGTIVGGAGAFTFRMTVPGGAQLPTRRRDGRRRPADAPPPRRPPLDDARPARRRARARRAARGALGIRGDDLRPLRLRARLARTPELDVEKSFAAFRPGVRAGRPRASRRLRHAPRSSCRRSTTRCSAVTPGMYERSEAWWREPAARRPARTSGSAAARSSSPCSRSTASRRHTRSTACTSPSATSGPETKLRTLEVIAATPAATASIWRYLLDVDWTKAVSAAAAARRPPAAPAACPSEPGEADDLRRALGAARRRRSGALGEDVRGRGLRRPGRPRRVLRLERGPLAARGRRGGTDERRRGPRARRLRSRLGLPGRLHVPRPAARRSPGRADAKAPSTWPTRSSGPRACPGAPRSSDGGGSGRSAVRAPGGCRPVRSSRPSGRRAGI